MTTIKIVEWFSDCPGRRPAFRDWPRRKFWHVRHVSSFSSVQVEAKSTELGASGEIPQIKTAQDKGSHRKKMWHTKIPSGSGDLDLCCSEIHVLPRQSEGKDELGVRASVRVVLCMKSSAGKGMSRQRKNQYQRESVNGKFDTPRIASW